MVESPSLGSLNRTLLARQLLLERVERSVPATVEHLVGMQAQNPLDPYYGLWARLAEFSPDRLAPLLEARDAVRMSLMRATLHLATTDDALRLRPVFQPVHERIVRSPGPHGRPDPGLDVDALLAAGRAWTTGEPRTVAELRRLIEPDWPGQDPAALARLVRYLLPLVQVTPRGVWGQRKQAEWTPVEHWVGRPLDPEASAGDVILRYLWAFGPASVQDIATWSGWTGVRALVEPLRDRLVTYRHPGTGRELLDVPEGILIHEDTPAPVRYLPEYDNVLLGHADRSRIVQVAIPTELVEGNAGVRFLLVDGFVAGTWTIHRDEHHATLVVEPLVEWSRARGRQVVDEGARLLTFAAPDLTHEIDIDSA